MTSTAPAVRGAARSVVEPVRQSTTVRSDRDHVFDVFVRELGQWWPTHPLSLGGADRVVKLVVEERLDGRVYEVWDDGTEADWGRILRWEPPERFAMTWRSTTRHEGGAETEVELRFVALGPSLTRVELEHRGWERLSADVTGSYDEGWAMVLERFAAHCA